ncbi:MAG: LuxR family transcriptional regulator [Gallionellaceae bacterium]
MNNFEQLADLLNTNSEMEWFQTLLRLGHEQGYEKMLLALTPDRQTLHNNIFVRSNYPSRWLSTYERKRLANIDPVVCHCIARSTPLVWATKIFASKPQKELYEDACAYGIRSGITLPFHGANGELGILCFVSDALPNAAFRKNLSRNIPTLSLLRDFAFESSLKFANPLVSPLKPPSLTRREMECIKWCAAGKKSWEIGLKMHCTERTVNFHLNNLRSKLKCKNRRLAVIKAMRLGLI